MSKDPLQAKIAALGEQFLERTRGEAARMRELFAQGALEELAQMAHKIHGTGATLGFAALGERAREIEHSIETRLRGGESADPRFMEALEESLRRFEGEL